MVRKRTPKPEPTPQRGDKVTLPTSDAIWEITSVRSSGNVNIERPGTNLTRFNVDPATLKFVERQPAAPPPPKHDIGEAIERIDTIQRESLERLDGDIAILGKYLSLIGAPKATADALEALRSEQHEAWDRAAERLEKLLEEWIYNFGNPE